MEHRWSGAAKTTFNLKNRWFIGGILILLVVLTFLFRQDLERVYNQFLFVDGFGRMYIDTFDYPTRYSISNGDCESESNVKSFRSAGANEFDEKSKKAQFFGFPADIRFLNDAKPKREGRVFAAFSGGRGRIEIDESCWAADDPSRIVLAYATTRVFPNFDELIFPILDMQGEFQIQVDILQQGHYNASSSTESIALASSFNSESLPNKEDYLGSYNHQLEYPLGIFSDLEILYPNSIHLGRHIDWNKAFAVIIAISGYGELRFSSPYFGQ